MQMASTKGTQKQKIPWFLTRAGRGFSFYSAVAAGVGGTLMYFLPNAIFSEKFSKIYQMYKYVFERNVHLKNKKNRIHTYIY